MPVASTKPSAQTRSTSASTGASVFILPCFKPHGGIESYLPAQIWRDGVELLLGLAARAVTLCHVGVTAVFDVLAWVQVITRFTQGEGKMPPELRLLLVQVTVFAISDVLVRQARDHGPGF